jgi:hypothetical protein
MNRPKESSHSYAPYHCYAVRDDGNPGQAGELIERGMQLGRRAPQNQRYTVHSGWNLSRTSTSTGICVFLSVPRVFRSQANFFYRILVVVGRRTGHKATLPLLPCRHKRWPRPRVACQPTWKV